MVFLWLNYVLGRHILGHREHESIENISNKRKRRYDSFTSILNAPCAHIP